MPNFRAFLHLAALSMGMAAATPLAAQVPTRISNTATMRFDGPAGPVSVTSNTIAFDVERDKRPTRIRFHLLPVGYRLGGMRCETGPTPSYTPAPVDAADFARAPVAETFESNEAIIIALDNPGGNRDPLARETSWITVDSPTRSLRLPLMETGPDTGIFAGGVPAAEEATNCEMRLGRGAHVTLRFDEDAYSYGSSFAMLIDPTGYLFDSQTGALIDGAVVTLLDENDRPAQVFGDDGISAYPSTVVSGGMVTDASGRVYDFPQGNYRFPLARAGNYRLKIEPPADYRAPSSRARADLEVLRDPSGQPFILNAASFGDRFTLSNPDPFIADVPLDRSGDTKLLLSKRASVREASPGDFIQYVVRVENRSAVAIDGVRLNDLLPRGLRYQRGSTRGAPEPAASADGRSLAFTLPVIAAQQSAELRYVVSVAPGAPQGEAVNRVIAAGAGGATSNEAAASVRLKALLFTDGFTVTGRVTEGDCLKPSSGRKGVPGIRLMLEDGTFVVTDRDGLYHFEGVRPGRHVVQLDSASIPSSHAPALCDADTRQAGSAISRFVESGGGLLRRVDFQLRPTGVGVAKAESALPLADSAAEAAGDRDWFSGQAAGVELLFPAIDHNPRAPVLRVVVKHLPGQRVALRINSAAVASLSFDSTDTQGGVAISKWTGVPLTEGDNVLEARVLNADGSLATTLRRSVHASGAPAVAKFVPTASRLIADGVTNPVLALRLTDRSGRPVRDGATVTVAIDQPYSAAVDTDVDPARGPARRSGSARVIGDQGMAYIALEPTTQAGVLRAAVTLGEGKAVHATDVRAWLTGAARDWTIVGFGAGTVGYDVLKGRSVGATARGRHRIVSDGQLALYAKGRIKGSWLLTIAYDSDRNVDRSRGLLGTIDPDRYYTVYGDGSRQAYDAPTSGKLYLRLERRDFYALFGDFESGMTQTQLTRYSRTLNGVKAEYSGGHVTFTGFAAHSEERFARDELQGNGLSGPYRLSGRDIVPNSDKLRIEVRDRLRPELIISSTSLTRHIDYDIDAESGTIRFRTPVLGRDATNNPVFIVAEYETYGRGRKLAAGGRAAVKLGNAEFGVSAIRDQAQTATVVGLDLRAAVSTTTEVRAELAAGGRQGLARGRAAIAEVEHHGAALDGLLYARQQDDAFGVSQQNIVEAGTRKIGLDARARLTDRLSVTGAAWHQAQLSGPGERIAGEARAELRRASGAIFAGGQVAFDRGIDGKARKSKLLTLGGMQALLDGKLTLTAQGQLALNGDKASRDFPARQQVTAAYRLSSDVRLIAGYEIAQGKDFTVSTAQIGFDIAPWVGAKLSGALNQQASGENGARTFAQYGLVQSVQLNEHWTIDATLDASTTVRGAIDPGSVVQPFQTSATGNGGSDIGLYGTDGDYVAATLGAGYRADRWSWNGRIEYRRSDDSDRFGVTTNLVRMLGEGKTLASSLKYFTVAQHNGSTARRLATDIALAWRPLDSRWSLLERLELRSERADAGVTDRNVLGVPAGNGGAQDTLRAINNLALNYRSGAEGDGHGFEGTVYYGAKWVRGSYDADDYAGLINVVGFDLRQDLGRHIDVGVQGSVQHAWNAKSIAFSFGPSAGVSPGRNVWITAGYNIAGYRDYDFEADRYTRAGPYLTMRMKFDRSSVGSLLGQR